MEVWLHGVESLWRCFCHCVVVALSLIVLFELMVSFQREHSTRHEMRLEVYRQHCMASWAWAIQSRCGESIICY
jgi:hypothetical protein